MTANAMPLEADMKKPQVLEHHGAGQINAHKATVDHAFDVRKHSEPSLTFKRPLFSVFPRILETSRQSGLPRYPKDVVFLRLQFTLQASPASYGRDGDEYNTRKGNQSRRLCPVSSIPATRAFAVVIPRKVMTK